LSRPKTIPILLLILVVAALGAGSKFLGVKEDLQRQRQGIDHQWSRVETALQRRSDVIPSLVEPLKPVDRQTSLLAEIDSARGKLAAAHGPGEKVRANRELSLALAKLLVQCETDSRIRSSHAFGRLREELAARDDEIANERFQYNNALEHYNARMQWFPDNVVASLAGFSRNNAYFGTGPDVLSVPKNPN
jgi:LemA protein